MRLLAYSYALLALSATVARAQVAPHGATAPDTASNLNAFLRTKGDTLWYTTTGARAQGIPTFVVLVQNSTVTALTDRRRVPLPANVARIFRNFYKEAQACPKPDVGCKLDGALLESLGQP